MLLIGISGLGFGIRQDQFWPVAGYYLLAFAGYFWAIRSAKPDTLGFWLMVAIGLRLLLVFAFPALSDDIYRFVWDGRLLVAGYNPFDHLPGWYLENGPAIPGIDQALYDQLNSPEYYTIYPPVAQFVFAVACWLFPTSLFGSALVMKLFLLAAEIGTLYFLVRLLDHWQLPRQNALWYALNPLMMVEIVGNLHFEGMMVFFLVLGLWWYRQGKLGLSGLAWALSVASKLLPLLFFPYLIQRLGWRRSFLFFSWVLVLLIALWLPLFNASFLANFGDSFDLYFRRFEFNGSLYFLIRWFGYQFSGFNLIRYIGPILALLVFVTIMSTALFDRDRSTQKLPHRWLFAIVLYLACATTVHPWYTALPLVLCVFTPFRFPVLWTALIPLTYITYQTDPYQENLWVVALEYALVGGFLIWELRRHAEGTAADT